MTAPSSRAVSFRAMAVGGGSQVVCSLPVFLTGAMAVQIGVDLQFGAVGLGAAVGTFHGTGAVMSVPMGRLVDRLGAIWSLRLAVLGAIVTAAGIALTASSWGSLATWLVFGGVVRSVALPAANRLLVNRVPVERLGIAFGLKQSAAPLASMLAGFAVPLVAVTLGWRAAFGMTALVALVAVFAIGPRPPITSRGTKKAGQHGPLRNRPALLILSVGFGLAFMVHSSVLGFYVRAAVDAGSSVEFAGTLLGLASIATIGVRMMAGAACDRTRVDPLMLSAAMVLIGGLAVALMSTEQPVVMGIAAIVALAGAWGFPGVFWYAMMMMYPDAPGRVTGALAPGAIGGVIGPLLFGVVTDRAGYPLAWLCAATVAISAASTMGVAARRLRVRDQQAPSR